MVTGHLGGCGLHGYIHVSFLFCQGHLFFNFVLFFKLIFWGFFWSSYVIIRVEELSFGKL